MSLDPMTENHIQAQFYLEQNHSYRSWCVSARGAWWTSSWDSRGVFCYMHALSVLHVSRYVFWIFFLKTLETTRSVSNLRVWVGIYKTLVEVTTSDNSLRWLNNWIVWCDESLTAYLMLMWMFHGSVWFTNYKECSCEVVCADVKFHLGTVCMERS